MVCRVVAVLHLSHATGIAQPTSELPCSGLSHKCLNRPGNVLQFQCAKFIKGKIEPILHMVPYRSRDADATGRTFGLKPCRYIYDIAMQISPVCDRIANVDSDTKADSPFRRLVAVIVGHLLLHLHGTAHRPVDAIEHDEQRIAAGLNNPSAMLLDCWVDNLRRRFRSRSSVPTSSSPINRL